MVKPRVTKPLTAMEHSFVPSSRKPGAGARYDLQFTVGNEVDTLVDELVIELEDYTVPSSISTTSMAIEVTDSAGASEDRSFAPTDIAVSGEKLTVYIGDMFTRDDTKEDFTISAGSNIEVTIYASLPGSRIPLRRAITAPYLKGHRRRIGRDPL